MAVHPSLLLNHRVILIASTFNRNVRASFNLLAKKKQTNPKSSSLNSSFESNSISSHKCIQNCRSISTDSSSTHQLSADAEINTNGSSPVALKEPLKHEFNNSLTFQQAIRQLQDFWASVGCAVVQSSSTEVGAGTMNPATFLRVLGPEPWNVAYVEPSIRPDDSRYGENPNRVQRHTQFQVILKPDPGNAQDLYLKSLSALGIDVNAHDIRFVEDNWESPVLGAWGLGWEVWMDGMEITQFTYFQQAGSLQLSPVSVEITYGLERIMISLQQVNHFKKIWYAPGITYGELFIESEREMSTYNLELADTTRCRKRFDLYDAEAGDMIEKGLAIPAYDSVLKASHVFNILDARGAIGVTERARFFGRMRSLARQCAQLWVQSRDKLNYPLGKWDPPSVFHHSSTSLEEAVAESLGPRTFILEIGSEELPPDDVSSGIDQLKSALQLLLKNRRLQHGKIYASGTPRRLVVVIEDLEPKQDNCEREVRGPPAIKSFNDDGSPTKALEGFCKKNGVTKEDTFIKSEGKVEYVFIRVKEEGRHALEVLAADIPDVIAGISFPKSMRWNSETVYSRPIRWFLALYGDMVLPFEYAGLCSGRFSHGLRASQSSILQVGRAEDYLTVLKNSNIKIDMEERRSDIWAAATSLAMDIGGTIPEDAKGSLLKEVANLVESPVPLLGRFDESFLRLPAEVLTTVMHKHQRYFPVVDAISGKLLPAFIAVANGEIDIAVVTRGNEAVLRARYEDAKFFYESDLSKPLSHFKPQLEGIIFQEKLGSMLDKSVRLESLILKLYEPLGMHEKSFTIAKEAASLARADLATSMVMEFTSLAGIMGRHYALCQGCSNEVANAIFESVLPRFAEDVLPETSAGLLLAVADRLDSLVGLFAVGCHPSASTDQFGLRRAAYGLVKMLVKSSVDLDLKVALQLAADVQPVPVSSNVQNDVLQFVIRRLEQLLVDSGNNAEFVRAVLAERGHIPALGSRSVGQMEEAAKRGSLKRIVEAYARPTRIVRGKEFDPSWKVNELLFEVPQEKALWSAYKETASGIYPGIGIDIFIQISGGLVEQLEDYFNNVFVMAKDEDLRKNRLAMLQNIAALPAGIVDLSVLPGF